MNQVIRERYTFDGIYVGISNEMQHPTSLLCISEFVPKNMLPLQE